MMLTKERQQTAYEAIGEAMGYKNRMAAPRVEKVIVSTGVGKKRDKKVLELIQDRLARITGQKAAPRSARMSIASFKVREGDVVGFQTTIRGARMYDFLDKLIHVALPRTRDFRGIPATAVDEMGNITIGIKEHTIFPETSDEEVKDVFGLAVTIVTTATSKKEAIAFFKHLGLPLRDK
jgi:large subunit ribosomal protein L5